MSTIEQAKDEGREAYGGDADLEKDNPYSLEENPVHHIAWRTGYQLAESNDPLAPHNMRDPDSNFFDDENDTDGDDD